MDSVATCKVMPLTSIKVDMKTRDRLADIGKKKETFDQIINRLIDHYEATKREN